MSTTVTVQDESASGKTLRQIQFEIPDEQITVRELIRSRVFQEVKDFNLKQAGKDRTPYQGLVQPTESEALLNGESVAQTVDWQRQFDRAVDAYGRGQILVLVDDRQTKSLDDEIIIKSESKISFLRLTVLTGG